MICVRRDVEEVASRHLVESDARLVDAIQLGERDPLHDPDADQALDARGRGADEVDDLVQPSLAASDDEEEHAEEEGRIDVAGALADLELQRREVLDRLVVGGEVAQAGGGEELDPLDRCVPTLRCELGEVRGARRDLFAETRLEAGEHPVVGRPERQERITQLDGHGRASRR